MTEFIREIRHPLISGHPPSWASGWGQDENGVWIELTLHDVSQRLRWIPPGEFLMGSPPDEEGRWDDETQHHVTLTQGFWLFDTPVTQSFWKAVMGANPSRFKSDKRPVENVSWNDCQKFLQKFDAESGLRLQLPTEAQWEYACRAGTRTATYAGAMKIVGERNAPVLDTIAWYGGNSGVDFDLDNGHDSSGWSEKQYDHQRAGTRLVALKQPNNWGLYDMLGNVWEWCSDWYADYPKGDVIDPAGPEQGEFRVIRGGSWRDYARNVRAAYRIWLTPDYRLDDLGFRCALVPGQEGAEAPGDRIE